MWPGRGPESDRKLCLAAQFRRKSVSAADRENRLRDRLVPPLTKPAGECGAVDIFAALVKRNQNGVFRNRGRYRRRLLRHSRSRVTRAAFGDFPDVEAAEAELAAGIVEARGVALGKFPLGALLQPADGNDDDSHGRAQ